MGKRGPYIVPGEVASDKYPGYWFKEEDNRYRKSCYRENKGKGPKLYSRYFFEATCGICGKVHLKDYANIRLQRSKSEGMNICSPECRKKRMQSPDGNLLRKHGKAINSHILVKIPTHPFARNGYVPQHRIVVEEKLGRILLKSELVHHVNCLKGDNRPENLDVFQSDKEHFLSHGSLNQCVARLISRGHLLYNWETRRYEVPD